MVMPCGWCGEQPGNLDMLNEHVYIFGGNIDTLRADDFAENANMIIENVNVHHLFVKYANVSHVKSTAGHCLQ